MRWGGGGTLRLWEADSADKKILSVGLLDASARGLFTCSRATPPTLPELGVGTAAVCCCCGVAM